MYQQPPNYPEVKHPAGSRRRAGLRLGIRTPSQLPTICEVKEEALAKVEDARVQLNGELHLPGGRGPQSSPFIDLGVVKHQGLHVEPPIVGRLSQGLPQKGPPGP